MTRERKLVRKDSLKEGNLKKTRARRERQSKARLTADRIAAARNDLLPDLQVRSVDIALLEMPAHETRKVTDERVETFVQLIARYGFVQPILVKGVKLIDGVARLAAARKLRLGQVPAIDVQHLSDAEVRTLRLALNRSQDGAEWDIDELKLEFLELIELEVDLSDTGFTLAEQDIILLDDGDGDERVSEEPEEPTGDPVSQLGDIWLLGGHRVICGNALEEAVHNALLDGDKAAAVVTDPPYNVAIKGNVSGLGKKVHEEFVMASGELDDTGWQTFLDTLMVRLCASTASGAVLYVLMDWRSTHRVQSAGLAAGLNLINKVIWFKESGGMGSLYRSSYEEIPVFCNGKTPRVNNVALGKYGRDRMNTWVMPGANRRGSSANEMLHLHATPKPVELCVDAILDVTNSGDLVLDAFLGSGTTLIAAEKTGRVCRGIELDPKFVDVSIVRWQEFSGDEAVLEATGESFSQVRERRSQETPDGDAEPEGGQPA